MINIDKKRTIELVNSCQGKLVAVIGDIMIDKYYWGNVSRISPEAPVPVIDLENETIHLGGAANVANNLKSLGIEPLLCGVLGKDSEGQQFLEKLDLLKIDFNGIYIDSKRNTTVKTRIIGNNQHIVRLDKEVRTSIDPSIENYFINLINNTEYLTGIIFEDYNKGVITKTLIKEIIELSKKRNIRVYVDPKFDNFFEYEGVTVFKPNKKEANQALRMPIESKTDIQKAGKFLLERLSCENVMLTLGELGMMLFQSNGEILSVPTLARRVADVSGAGDTAIATLAAMMSGGANIQEAVCLANIAAGIVCEFPGIVPITINDLIDKFDNI